MRALPMTVLLLLVPLASGALPLQPPAVDFHWQPAAMGAHEDVTFFSESYDMDGMILLERWSFAGDDAFTLRTGSTWTTSFSQAGQYAVTLEVIDSTGQRADLTRVVTVQNTPPVLSIVAPEAVYRGRVLDLAGSAIDVDGDAVVGWTWQLGDGSVLLGQNVSHVYGTLGLHTIHLDAQDAAGNAASASIVMRVVNDPPELAASYAPAQPRPGEVVTFTASAMDPDGAGVVTYAWRFSDGVHLAGAQVTRTFPQAGYWVAEARARDAEGASSAPVMLQVHVGG